MTDVRSAARSGTAAAILACVGLWGCSVSTVAGPVWSSRSLVGVSQQSWCLVAASVEIDGGNAWLEQHARQEWLRLLAGKREHCQELPRARLDVSELRVRTVVDAYGSPASGRPDAVPPPARQRVSVTAQARLVACRDGREEIRQLDAGGWIPYSADPFIVEERAQALVAELVDAQVRDVDVLLSRLECGTDDPGAATPASDATEPSDD